MRLVNGKNELFDGKPLFRHPHAVWPDGYVYIGRRVHGFSGYFGNPCGTPGGCPCGRVNPAGAAPLACYKSWLDARCDADHVFRDDVASLWDPGVTLVCFCRPRLCHGDFLLLKAATLNGARYVPDIPVPTEHACFFPSAPTSEDTAGQRAKEEEFERQLRSITEDGSCQR